MLGIHYCANFDFGSYTQTLFEIRLFFKKIQTERTFNFNQDCTSMTMIQIFKKPYHQNGNWFNHARYKKMIMEISLSYECNQLTGTQWVSVSNLSKVVFSSLNATVRSSFTIILSKRWPYWLSITCADLIISWKSSSYKRNIFLSG